MDNLDDLQLSSNDEYGTALQHDTLELLHEFLREKADRELREREHIINKAGKAAKFEEDWQLSQFWYSESTKNTLGQVIQNLVAGHSTDYSIALLSCPSLYSTVKDIHDNVKIFEFDKRFAAYGDDFVFYDLNGADVEDSLKHLQGSFDVLIADPPFLSEECIAKMAKIITALQRPKAKIIFCSGDVVEPWLMHYLQLNKCGFRPEHERNLGNEFASYANFDLDDFIVKK